MSNTTNTCIHGVINCNHSEIKGKGKLLALSEKLVLHTEGMRPMCDTNEQATREDLYGLMAWMEGLKDWNREKIIGLLTHYKGEVLKAHRNTDGENVSDMQIQCVRKDTPEDMLLEGMALQEDYMDELDRNSYKSEFSMEAQLLWWNQKIMDRETELKLHDKIQDKLDGITPVNTKGHAKDKGLIKSCFSRIDALKKEGKLGYAGWFTFNNQLLELVGKDQWVAKYEIHSLPDTIAYYTMRMEAKRDEINKKAEEKGVIEKITLEPEDDESLLELIAQG